MRSVNTIFVIALSWLFLPLLANANDSCKTPSPLFGKIVAICGDQMITYVGDQQKEILGVPTTTSRFELAYCSTGGGRKPLNMETNSNGYQLKTQIYERGNVREQFTIVSEGNHYKLQSYQPNFRMFGTDWEGNPVKVPCTDYNDTREDIEYLEFYF